MKNNKIYLIIAITIISIGLLFHFLSKPQNKIVNIAYGTNPDYIKYTKVSIYSAIKNKKPDSIYKITVLCSDLTDNQRKEFEKFNSENVTVKTISIDISKMTNISKAELKKYKHPQNLYKLVVTDYITDIDKVLYLDSDVIVLKDLTKLYNTNIKNKYLAAAPKIEQYSYDIIRTENGYKKFAKMKYYYDIGVVLYNLEKWQNSDVKGKIIDCKGEDDITHKYHLLTSYNTVIPKKTIKVLPLIYNEYSRWTKMQYDSKKYNFPFICGVFSYEDLRKKAVIIRFADIVKPWEDKNVNLSNIWWEYAKMFDTDIKSAK